MKYKVSRDLPTAIRELQSLDRDEIIKYVLNKFNKKITVHAINMWLNRHKDVYERLKAELEDVPKGAEDEVRPSLFAKGVFESIPIIDEYVRGKKRKKTVKLPTLRGYVIRIKKFCMGTRPNINPETQTKYRRGEWAEQKKRWKKEGVPEEHIVKGINLKKHGWVLRHPERIQIGDVNEHLDLMIEHYPDVDNSGVRLALRNFFKYHDIKGVDQISGRKHKSVGKYADLKLPKEKLFDMFDYMREKAVGFIDPYYQAYCACKFMYQTGTRISATLNAVLDNIQMIDVETDGISRIVNIVVYDKGSLSVHGERGHRWVKKITTELYNELCLASNYPERKRGKIFRIDEEMLRDISREAIEKFSPETLESYPDLKVIHFWRHMMGQHWLEATHYNYGIVSAIGGWTVKAMEESYGKIPESELRELGIVYLPRVMERE